MTGISFHSFITGHSTFDDDELEDDEIFEFWNLATQLLKNCGRLLEECTIYPTRVPWVYFYEHVLIPVTRSIPNLRALSLNRDYYNWDQVDDYNFTAEERSEECKEFENIPHLRSLPELKNLVCLDIITFPGIFTIHLLNHWGSEDIKFLCALPGHREQVRADLSMIPNIFKTLEILQISAPTTSALRHNFYA